ncbi:hypothetical protein FH972_024210 [Carpinus fangiana]|uniref:Uncharacterized protein n=1 Tax=Carpinus fangiana TaxID=176857 RepID=A0A5N6KXE0_9ROSI|nr:hypothetical protein FH972_024210 [Carpinus fangiana]
MSGKESKPPSSPSKGKAPATSVPDSSSGLASRIGASAGGLLGDLLAPTSTTQTLASAAAAQDKASRGESSTAGVFGAAPAGQSTWSDRASASNSIQQTGFREAVPYSSAHEGERLAEHMAEVEQPNLGSVNLLENEGFSRPYQSFQNSHLNESLDGHIRNHRETRLNSKEEHDFHEAAQKAGFPSTRPEETTTATELEAATWIAQFHDAAAGERTYYKDVMRHARGGSAVSERGAYLHDGADVVRLLDSGGPFDYSEEEDTATSSSVAPQRQAPSAAEPEVTADDLFGSDVAHGSVPRDNPANLRPDFAALDPRADPVTGEVTGQPESMRDVLDGMQRLDEWNEVLDSYTDDVWGPEELAKAKEARAQLEEARKEETQAVSENGAPEKPALRRLRELMGQLELQRPAAGLNGGEPS